MEVTVKRRLFLNDVSHYMNKTMIELKSILEFPSFVNDRLSIDVSVSGGLISTQPDNNSSQPTSITLSFEVLDHIVDYDTGVEMVKLNFSPLNGNPDSYYLYFGGVIIAHVDFETDPYKDLKENLSLTIAKAISEKLNSDFKLNTSIESRVSGSEDVLDMYLKISNLDAVHLYYQMITKKLDNYYKTPHTLRDLKSYAEDMISHAKKFLNEIGEELLMIDLIEN